MSKSKAKTAAAEKPATGFRLEVFNFFVILFTVVITVSLCVVIFMAHMTYDAFYDATEQYIVCRQSAENVHEASDYLTREVRAFAEEGKLEHMNNYFNEVNTARRRENSLETIKKYDSDNAKNEHLESANKCSFELMTTEYYSMRLVLEADGVPEAKYPDVIKHTALKDEDKLLSNEEKRALAKEILYDTEYVRCKDEIYKNISIYTEDILSGTRERERENSVKFAGYQSAQIVLIIILLGILTINVAFTSIFLIRPLRKNSKLIVEQNSLPVKGPEEMRTFAKLYNNALAKIKSHQAALSYEASHDSLTGIQNRSVFDEMYRTVKSTEELSLALVDIDDFKGINDSYGHEAGDDVLKKVASLLRSSFRSGDVICRIGGDEFTVIMNGVTPDYREQLTEKFEAVASKLKKPAEGAVQFTISVGIAFGSSDCSFKELYKNADKALYAVKETTKDGLKFYKDL